MSDFLSVADVDVSGKHVLVRADLEWPGINSPREKATREIVKYLQDKGAVRIKVVGHKGNISQVETLGVDVFFEVRSDPREEENSDEFAAELALGFDIYVNEAFATSHREHASIEALPRLMASEGKTVCAGLRFVHEIEVLRNIFVDNPNHRRVLVIGGAKAGDKAKYADLLENKFDAVLRGGLLGGAELRPDGLDISDARIERYCEALMHAETIVLAGPMGKYEDESASRGTREVFTAATESKAYTIAGGGDTEAALSSFGLVEKINWISVGGGAMLEFLAAGTLPGIEALVA